MNCICYIPSSLYIIPYRHRLAKADHVPGLTRLVVLLMVVALVVVGP